MKNEKKPGKKKSWYHVTSKGKVVAMVDDIKTAKALQSENESEPEKFETFEDAFREFKQRWRNIPKRNQGKSLFSMDEYWNYVFAIDELIAVVKGEGPGMKIMRFNSDRAVALHDAGSYTRLIRNIEALLKEGWPQRPHENILNSILVRG